MSSRNVDKGREAENAVVAVFRANGMPHAERRSKRGGYMTLPSGQRVHRDAGDLTGIPGVVVQVKWSDYSSLITDMDATERQRQAAGAEVGLLVRKRKGVGLGRAEEWDAFLPSCQVHRLMVELAWFSKTAAPPMLATLGLHWDPAPWRADLITAVRLLAAAGFGTPVAVTA